MLFKRYIHCVVVGLSVICSCANTESDSGNGNTFNSQNKEQFLNDTAAMIRACLDSALAAQNKRKQTILDQQHSLSDTVFVIGDSVLSRFFSEKINNRAYKFLTEYQYCSKIAALDSTVARCLVLTGFHRDSSGNYYAFIENNQAIVATYSKNGVDSKSCDYTLLGGWELLLFFEKGRIHTPVVKSFSSY